jgi:hypothetical protein
MKKTKMSGVASGFFGAIRRATQKVRERRFP